MDMLTFGWQEIVKIINADNFPIVMSAVLLAFFVKTYTEKLSEIVKNMDEICELVRRNTEYLQLILMKDTNPKKFKELLDVSRKSNQSSVEHERNGVDSEGKKSAD
jgi:flagellar motor component MotA